MNVIRFSDRNLVKVNYTVYLSSGEYSDIITVINCLVVPCMDEKHEEARQLLLSEISEMMFKRIKSLLIQMITVI